VRRESFGFALLTPTLYLRCMRFSVRHSVKGSWNTAARRVFAGRGYAAKALDGRESHTLWAFGGGKGFLPPPNAPRRVRGARGAAPLAALAPLVCSFCRKPLRKAAPNLEPSSSWRRSARAGDFACVISDSILSQGRRPKLASTRLNSTGDFRRVGKQIEKGSS
jgi:hypothetical protein